MPPRLGAVDKRYYPRARIAEALSPAFGWDWAYVRKEAHPEGITSISGPVMYQCHRVRDRLTGREELVGDGELARYCGVQSPSHIGTSGRPAAGSAR